MTAPVLDHSHSLRSFPVPKASVSEAESKSTILAEVRRSQLEAEACKRQLSRLRKKVDGSVSHEADLLAKEIGSVPAIPRSSAEVLARISINDVDAWSEKANIHELGDCDPVQRLALLKRIGKKALRLDPSDRKAVVASILSDLKRIESEPATLLIQFSTASALLFLAERNLVENDSAVTSEINSIRAEYSLHRRVPAPGMSAFEVTRFELAYSEEIRARLQQAIDRARP